MMHLEQKALESATDAALSRFNDDTAPRRCENWRAHLREMASDAIRAYLSASLPKDAVELVAEMTSEDFRHEMQHLRSSSEIDMLFHRAASLIQSQAARIAELEAVLHTTRSLVSEAALTGFNCHDGKWAEQLYANQAAISKAIEPSRALLTGESKG